MAQRDHRVELVVERHLARIDLEEGRGHSRGARSVCSDVEEPSRNVDSGNRETSLGKRHGVPPGPASDVKDPRPRIETKLLYEERDLLFGAFGEVVAQVRRAETLGDRSEIRLARVRRRGAQICVSASTVAACEVFSPRSIAHASRRL